MAEEVDVKKLAEWAGFKLVASVHETELYTHPDLPENSFYELPNFPLDETACYRWLVPEAMRRGYRVELLSYKGLNEGDETHIGIIKEIDYPYNIIFSFVQPKPALALCKAFEGFIEWEKKR